jgi:hypothetical protein
MVEDQYLKSLVKANSIIIEDMLTNNNFKAEELELVQSKMASMIEQLEFWSLQDNRERFAYELKSHIAWLLKTFS